MKYKKNVLQSKSNRKEIGFSTERFVSGSVATPPDTPPEFETMSDNLYDVIEKTQLNSDTIINNSNQTEPIEDDTNIVENQIGSLEEFEAKLKEIAPVNKEETPVVKKSSADKVKEKLAMKKEQESKELIKEVATEPVVGNTSAIPEDTDKFSKDEKELKIHTVAKAISNLKLADRFNNSTTLEDLTAISMELKSYGFKIPKTDTCIVNGYCKAYSRITGVNIIKEIICELRKNSSDIYRVLKNVQDNRTDKILWIDELINLCQR